MCLVLTLLLALSAPGAGAQELRCPPGTEFSGGMPPDGGERGCSGRDKHGETTRHGPWITYYMNGSKESAGDYVEGRRSGKWAWWYPDGRKRQEGQYFDGRPTGRWVYWDEKGRKLENLEGAAGLDGLGKTLEKGFK